MTAAYMHLTDPEGVLWFAARSNAAGRSTLSGSEAHIFDFDPDLPHHMQPAFAIASPLWKHAAKYGVAHASIIGAGGTEIARLEMNTAGVVRVVAPAVTS